MGDYGKIYATYTKEMCEEMKKLVQYADIITPNITELCILTDTPYQEKWKISELEKMTEELAEKGPEKIVVTGIVQKEFIANFCYESNFIKKCILKSIEMDIPVTDGVCFEELLQTLKV